MARAGRQPSDPPVGILDPEVPSELAGARVGLIGFGDTTRRLLEHLKRVGDASAEDLADALGVSLSAARQQLAPLEARGLVAHHDQRPGPGRPRRRYCLTPAAHTLWPRRYGELANQLLGFVNDSDPDMVDSVFDRRRQQRVARAAARMDGLDFAARVTELAAILDEDGYLADSTELGPGRWLVTEHNCAIRDVAEHYGQACRSELAFLQQALPDAKVERVAHMVAGAHVCAYQVTAR